MSLTPEQRDELAQALYAAFEWGGCDGASWARRHEETREKWRQNADALAPVIANWLAAEREAGAAEVRARIERLEPTWPRGMYGCPDDMFSRRDLNRALTTEEPS